MNLRVLAIAAVGLVAGGLLALKLIGPPDPSATVKTSGKVAVGGPFSLIDHTGKRVTERDFLGRKTLMFFGFTNCPDICPSGLQVVAAALDALGPKADAITPVFVSVDPERDTPERMAEYVKSFHPRLVGLTGSVAEVTAAAKAYRVYFRKAENKENPQSYSVDHSSIFYLMDEQGQYLRHFSHPIDAAKLAVELAKSL